MAIKDVKLAVYPELQVTSVTFNGQVYDFQLTANNDESVWLW